MNEQILETPLYVPKQFIQRIINAIQTHKFSAWLIPLASALVFALFVTFFWLVGWTAGYLAGKFFEYVVIKLFFDRITGE